MVSFLGLLIGTFVTQTYFFRPFTIKTVRFSFITFYASLAARQTSGSGPTLYYAATID
jgi:hypothetical protein